MKLFLKTKRNLAEIDLQRKLVDLADNQLSKPLALAQGKGFWYSNRNEGSACHKRPNRRDLEFS